MMLSTTQAAHLLESWIDLAESIKVQGAEPVLSDFTYNCLVEEIRGIVGDNLYAAV
jgi:hypothetical protein